MLLSCRSWLKNQVLLPYNLNCKITIFILRTLTILIGKGKKTSVYTDIILQLKYTIPDIPVTHSTENHMPLTIWK